MTSGQDKIERLARMIAECRRAVVFTNNSSGHRTAKALELRGIDVAAVVDSRDGAVISDVIGAKKITAVEVYREHRRERIGCDFVAMSGGVESERPSCLSPRRQAGVDRGHRRFRRPRRGR